MSKASTYYCSVCGYRVTTTAGPSSNFFSKVNTFLCQTCKEVKDKVTHRIYRKEYGDTGEDDLLGRTIIDRVEELTPIVCTECNTTDLPLWDTLNKPCPRCNHSLKKDENGIVILAD